VLLAPKKKTVMIGIDGYSPDVKYPNINIYPVGQLRVSFIESHNYKFCFYENYNPRRNYHYIYSNSRRIVNTQ